MKLFPFVAVLLVALLLGCSSGKSLDGTWNVASSANLPPGTILKATFSDGKTVRMTMDMPQDLPGGKKIELHGDVTGTYKLESENLSIHADDVKFTGSGFPAELKPMLESSLSSMGNQVKEKLNQEGIAKLVWIDGDKFTVTGASGKPDTYTRAK